MLLTNAITRIRFKTKNVQFGDNFTCEDFHSKLKQFIVENETKDTYISWNVKYDIQLEKKKMIVTTRQQIFLSTLLSFVYFLRQMA